MPLLSNIVKSVEFAFPVSFLISLLGDEDTDEQFIAKSNAKDCALNVKRMKGIYKESNLCISLNFLASSEKLIKGHLKCCLTNISKIQTPVIQTNIKQECPEAQLPSPIHAIPVDLNVDENTVKAPRKRGRPKGKRKPSSNNADIEPSQPQQNMCGDSYSPKSKYHLRGVKLSSKIMKMEKKIIQDEDMEEDNEEEEVNYVICGYKGQEFLEKENLKAFNMVSTNINAKNNLKESDTKLNSEEEEKVSHDAGKTSIKYVQYKPKLDALLKEKKTDVPNMKEAYRARPPKLLKDLRPATSISCCVICDDHDISFFSKQELKDHEIADHSSLECVKCSNGKIFKHITSLRSHCIWIHGKNSQTKKHMCHLCSSTYKFASSLREHIEEIHEGKSNLECKVCTKTFYKSSQLRRHEKIHGDVKSKILCEICGQGFWHESNRQRHIRLVHKKPLTEQFHCPYCGKGFAQKAGMVSHIKLIHLNLINIRCSICNDGFSRSKALVHHMVQVHNDKGFKAPEVRPLRFKYNRTLDEILRCSKCAKSFYYKAELIEHMHTTHADSFSFVCTECNQGFMQQSFLIRHRKVAHKVILTQEEEEALEAQWAISKGLTETESEIKYISYETENNVSYVTPKNVQYMIQNDENLICERNETGNLTLVTGEKPGEVTYLTADDIESGVTYLSNETDHVTFVTNVEYGNLEEVETSICVDEKGEVIAKVEEEGEMVGESVIFQVEDGESTVSYVIQPLADGNTPEIAAQDIADMLLVKHAATISENTEESRMSTNKEILSEENI